MHNPDPQAASTSRPLAVRWRRFRACYRFANLASHHVLGFAIKLVLLVYFALAVLFLVLRYAILPNIDLYKSDIERVAGNSLGSRVTITRLSASWQGMRPALSLVDVRLHDRKGRQVLALPQINATLGWWSVAALDPALRPSRSSAGAAAMACWSWPACGSTSRRAMAAAPTGCCASARS
jgi:hypothetical protein